MKTIESNSIKVANTDFPIIDHIKNRWSARSFSDQPIEEEVLMSLFEAARWAPSSMNAQPWRYVYACKEDKTDFLRFHECLSPGNQPWAINAAVMILCLADIFNPDGKTPNKYNLYDVGAANAQLLIEAASRNIYGHLMGGFDLNKTIEAFNIPENLEPVCFLALGYLDAPDLLTEPFRTRELSLRSRKSVPEFIFRSNF